jgi:hypothetical protein
MKLDYMKHGFFASLVLLLFTSCFKEEPKNMECDILEAWVEGESYTAYFFNSADMRVLDVPSNEQKVEFTVRSQATLPALPVHFKLSPGATIVPGDGTEQDFSKGPVTYTVTSEDGEWSRQYTVSFRNPVSVSKFDFENYSLDEKGQYYVWYEKGDDGAKNEIWASGNAGFLMAKSKAPAEDYPTVPDPNGYEGSSVRLITRDTGSWGKTFKKPIAAGNLFLGKFNSKFALTQTLKTTEMGLPFMQEPVKVTGYYKFTPGETFTDKDMKSVPGRVDEPNIYAVFYRNQDAGGNTVVLHGDDVMTSPLIVSKAQVASLPPTTEWTKFEMTFDSQAPIDQTVLNNRGYNLALVFSSSKTGDTFEGAVGSTLCVDKVEVSFKANKE